MNRRVIGAFTLIELLMVIAVISMLIALLFPVLSTVEEKANRAKCQSNLHQIGVAAIQQFGDLGDKLPNRDGANYGFAAEQLMPYVKNIKEVFDCPSKPRWKREHYLMSNHNFYVEYEFNKYLCSTNPMKRQSGIFDYSITAYAYDILYDLPSPPVSTPHGDGVNVAYLDGHSAWLPCSEHGIDYSKNPPDETTNSFLKKGHIWQ